MVQISEIEAPAPPGGGNRRWAGVAMWLATGSYLGRIPIMPGTFGTLAGIPVTLGLEQIANLWLRTTVFAVLWIVAVPICTIAAARLGAKDPGAVVLDEILALPIVFFGLHHARPSLLAAGFCLFRLFDILKPPPIREIERLPRGLGIMADDVIAAIYALAVLRLMIDVGLLSI